MPADGSLMEFGEPDATGKRSIKNSDFGALIAAKPNCETPVLRPPAADITTTVVACGDGNDLTPLQISQCMECLYGYDTISVCSRDNFSIRPEAFDIKVYDDKQGTSGVKTELPEVSNTAAGYNYRYDFIATSHIDENPVVGYTQGFLTPFADHNISNRWSPTGTVSGCNDIVDKYLKGYLVNGLAAKEYNRHNNVGEYSLVMTDSSWTMVDQIASHHVGVHYNDKDCAVGESFVPSETTVLNSTNVGCTISSVHTNVDRNKYKEHNTTVHPYKFGQSDLPLISFYRGIANTVVQDNSFVYMNSLNADSNMSARYDGTIRPLGADNSSLSNYVDTCFAKPVDLTVTTSALHATPIFRYRLFEYDFADTVLRDTNGTNGGSSKLAPIMVPASSFTKGANGQSKIILHLNFDRAGNAPINPEGVRYGNFDVNCSVLSDCQSYADLSTTHNPNGEKEVNSTVIYLYGRVNAPRRVVMCGDATGSCTSNMSFYYEFYADKDVNGTLITNLLGTNPQRSVNSVNWYRNLKHTLNDGEVKSTKQATAVSSGTAATANGVTTIPYSYTGAHGYPYKVRLTITQKEVEPWLIYDKYNAAATQTSANLEFYGPGKWTSTSGSNSTHSTEAGKKKKTNRRIQW